MLDEIYRTGHSLADINPPDIGVWVSHLVFGKAFVGTEKILG